MSVISDEHIEKFENFIKACQVEWVPNVIVATLDVIWDNTKEVLTNFHILEQHWKSLVIANSNLKMNFTTP